MALSEHGKKWAADRLAAERVETNGQPVGPPDEPPRNEPEDTPVYADHLLTRSALRKLPDPEPLINNVLDQGTTALLYGRWGTAKTFIALDWAASVATGRPWQGRKTVQRRGLYVVAEGAFGFNVGDGSKFRLARPGLGEVQGERGQQLVGPVEPHHRH
jgi:hypothetical protein